MSNTSKLGTLLFIGLMSLPILGLLIMDYQLKRANDITGAYVIETSGAGNVFYAALVIGVLVSVFAFYVFEKVHSANLVHTMPLAKINSEINKIDEHLKNKGL